MNVQLFKGSKQPCSYLPQLLSQNLVLNPQELLDPEKYDLLLNNGFRRSGDIVYMPECPSCKRCKAIRLNTQTFKYRRNQKRILKRNKDIKVKLVSQNLTQEQFALYQKYTQSRHQEGGMAEATFKSTEQFFQATWGSVAFIEFRLLGRLVAMAVTDIMPTSLSAVYTFFDPDLNERSLGVFAILKQFEICQQRQLDYLYLGYWIKDCQKMKYKQDYQPAEILENKAWIILDPSI